MNLSIRQKLILLAGIPVLGAIVLSAQVIAAARDQAKLAESLGSVENLVEASVKTTQLIHRLEQERSAILVTVGARARAHADSSIDAAFDMDVHAEVAGTDEALAELNQFLSLRDEQALPKKFGTALRQARVLLGDLNQVRDSAAAGRANWEVIGDYYERAIRSLTGTVAGLSELSNDGELLRPLNALVALLELEAHASSEHSLFAHVLAAGDFPPGSYRKLVTTISEEDIYSDVFRTVSSLEVQRIFAGQVTPSISEPVLTLRRKILAAADDDLTLAPQVWLTVTRPQLNAFQNVEKTLHQLCHALAVNKIRSTKKGVYFSTTLASTIVLFSLLLATALARGISRRLDAMRGAVERVGDGDLEVRVDAANGDELGRLGAAFNDMIGEISHSRLLLGTQARMARDLEIATEIQRAMVPRTPTHPHFEFAGNMLPADEVGGDFYDVLTDTRELWITIGDVCGHGIGSGLVMLMTQVAFASNFLQDPKAEPDSVWRRVNRLLCDNISGRLNDNRYVTAQLLVHRGDGRFVCVGAHQSPMVYRKASNRVEVVDSLGPWLGIDPTQSFVPVSEIQLAPGDVLCLYSDGLPEAQDKVGELFDVDRLAESLHRALARTNVLEDAASDVYSAVEAFSSRRDDDWTMLLIRYRHDVARILADSAA